MRVVFVLVAGMVIGCAPQLTFAQTKQPDVTANSSAATSAAATPAASATEPQAAETAAPPAHAAPNESDSTPTSSATPDGKELSDAEKAAARKEAIDTRGYQELTRDGVRYYCSNTPVLGSRLKSRTTCMTLEQLQRARQEAQDKLREKQGQRTTKDG